jgi:hypothetical protein
MEGAECSMREGIDYEGYVAKLLLNNQAVIQRIGATGNMATQTEIAGLSNVLKNIMQYVQAMSQDEAKKSLVKQIQDMMGQQMNEIKGYAQRLQEQQQQQAGNDPETMAKVQGMVLQAQTKAKITEATAAQKIQHKEVAFRQKAQHDVAKHGLGMQKDQAALQQNLAAEQARTITGLKAQDAGIQQTIAGEQAKTRMNLQAQQANTEQAIASEQAKTVAQIQAEKLKAENAPEPKAKSD